MEDGILLILTPGDLFGVLCGRKFNTFPSANKFNCSNLAIMLECVYYMYKSQILIIYLMFLFIITCSFNERPDYNFNGLKMD